MTDLSTFFSTLNLYLSHPLHTSPSLTVYQAERTDTGTQATVSLYPGLNAEAYTRMYAAAELQYELRDLQGVVQLSNYGWVPQAEEGLWTFFAVQDLVGKDLAEDIEDRKHHHFTWTEEVLVSMSKNIISTLAELQRRGIAHRDLNLHSLRYHRFTESLKLSAFSQACKVTNQYGPVATQFMSPEQAYIVQYPEYGPNYDPFKADVYSLGMCLLRCCCLDVLESREEEANYLVKLYAISSRDLKGLLYYMLQSRSTDRPDFLALQQYIYTPIALPDLNCPHISPEMYCYFCPFHGRFCQYCVLFADSIAYCAICRTQFVEIQTQNIQPPPDNNPEAHAMDIAITGIAIDSQPDSVPGKRAVSQNEDQGLIGDSTNPQQIAPITPRGFWRRLCCWWSTA